MNDGRALTRGRDGEGSMHEMAKDMKSRDRCDMIRPRLG
jgi:hypothetical protein